MRGNRDKFQQKEEKLNQHPKLGPFKHFIPMLKSL